MWRWRGDSGGIAWRSFGDHVEMVGRWWEDGGEMVERSSRCAVWAVPPMHQKLQPYVREVATLCATPCRDPYAFCAATPMCAPSSPDSRPCSDVAAAADAERRPRGDERSEQRRPSGEPE